MKPDTGSTEYFVSYGFNSLGFRRPDYAVPEPPNTFRTLALGDSYTLGVGVRERDTFEAQLRTGSTPTPRVASEASPTR